MTFPKKHISIRVPWHDSGWDGRVCATPRLNGSCLKLARIVKDRDDEAEQAVAGKSMAELPEEKWPCCVPERGMFMAPFGYNRTIEHPYKNKDHAHFAKTFLRHPPFSAPIIAYNWIMRSSMEKLRELYSLNISSELEPQFKFPTNWVQHHENQKAIHDCFCGHIKPTESLCLFYAKKVPFVEDTGGQRILIGAGRVLHISPGLEYQYNTNDLDGKLRSMLWDLMVQHSIRPDFNDGFILPYHAAMALGESNPNFDPASIAAFAPSDRVEEFSYAAELVTHDGAIASLLACAESLRQAKKVIPGPWDQCLQWIDQRLGEMWVARGPCPGLGSALSAFGLTYSTAVAMKAHQMAGENADPWPVVVDIIKNPDKFLETDQAKSIGTIMPEALIELPPERLSLLKLVSRFEISREQAEVIYQAEKRKKANIHCSDSDLLANPYMLYEQTRLTKNPISLWSIDRGVFPDGVIREKHPLPQPTALDSDSDARRVCALAVTILEKEADNGNSLMPQNEIIEAINQLEITPKCNVTGDLLHAAKKKFSGEVVEAALADKSPALQLNRLAQMVEIIRNTVERRVKGQRLEVQADWRELLDQHLDAHGTATIDSLEEKARQEKTEAIKELAESRFSALVGPAGTGKTTLLSVLCSHPQIKEGKILLLAPTGKARVKMEQSTSELNLKGYTIAQYLARRKRYDIETGRYLLSGWVTKDDYKTVIVDESSMLTEDMLAALIEALKGVERLILIGDPRQLPPIGTGRPFVDIVKHLAPAGGVERFPCVAPGYAELTIKRRQVGEEREDLQLAELFRGTLLAPGEDEVFDKVIKPGSSPHVRFEKWFTADELRAKLVSVVVEEIGLDGPDDLIKFEQSLGGVMRDGQIVYDPLAAQHSEDWQILSPVRCGAHGVPDVNRLIHRQFRQKRIDSYKKSRASAGRPIGSEEIIYGDKVINLLNTDLTTRWNNHRNITPKKERPFIANGEIGLVVDFGGHKKSGDTISPLKVEFSSQPGFKYDYTNKEFGEEKMPIMELAYALTVHKSQGSEFGIVILVLPNPCRNLSRELIYTALTRHKKRVVIMHQGDRESLLLYSRDDHSDTARRLTNLFSDPSPIYINDKFYEQRLIHQTLSQEMVRSESEVTIANELARLKIYYQYEHPLTLGDSTRYPDFTIDDIETGRRFFWEHCSMLHVPSYRQRWEAKLKWYKDNGIIPPEDGEGKNGTLIVTREPADEKLSPESVGEIIRKVILGQS